MDEWDLAFLAPQLKGKQERMQTGLTEALDLLNSMKEELALLRESWEGQAGEIYCASFEQGLSRGYECAGKIGELIGSLTEAEGEFERCEAEILSLTG